MKKIFTINVLIISLLFSHLLVFAQKPDFKQLDSYIQNAQKTWNIPGIAIAIVDNDKVVFSKGYGVKEFGKPGIITDESLFAIASNTKAFTASALLMLEEQGKLNLNDPVQKYLPWFKLYDPYVSANLTIRDLLCHRSGFKTFSGDLLWYGTSYSRKEVLERVRFLKPAYGFREKYGYSNLMFLAAGEIIPAVTGKSWDEFIKENFLLPLGMKNTNTSIRNFTNDGNIAMPHHVAPGADPVVIKYVNWDNIAPAGAINSNVKELSEWIKLQLNNGVYNNKRILSENSIRQMRSVNTPKLITKWSEENFPSKHYSGYGLGWDLFDYLGRNIVNHGGGADGMISKVVLVPGEKLGFVILTNSINDLPTALTYYILDLYYGKEHKDWSQIFYGFYTQGIAEDIKHEKDMEINRIPNTPISLPNESYIGTYTSKLYGQARISVENGNFVIYFLPTSIFVGDMTHYQLNTFKVKLRDQPAMPGGKVNFVIGSNGKVSKMEVDIPNPDFDFTELEFVKD